TSSSAPGGSSYSFSTPRRPADSISAKARYGLQAGSGARTSTLVELALPGLYVGTRHSTNRFRCLHDTYAEASATGAVGLPDSCLYAFTHWLVTAVVSRACRSSPAMNARAVLDRLSSSDGSWKALRSPSNRDRWVCMPEPGWSVNGFGMNVAYTPSAIATSFTTCRNVMMLSAVVSASAYRRSISCWPGATSWWLNSTEMPSASSASTAIRRKSRATEWVVWSKYPPVSTATGGPPPGSILSSRKNSISGWV